MNNSVLAAMPLTNAERYDRYAARIRRRLEKTGCPPASEHMLDENVASIRQSLGGRLTLVVDEPEHLAEVIPFRPPDRR